MKKEIVILTRTLNQKWNIFALVDSLETAEHIWRTRIKGRGITAWVEFATKKEADKMLKNSNHENKSKEL